MSFETVCLSMYSDISSLIIAFSSLNNCSASAFANSVFHTHVGHRKRNEPIGLDVSFNQARALLTALATACTASSCPTTLFPINSSR